MTVLLRASDARRLLSNAVLATASDTGGRYSLYRIELGAGSGGARPHYHQRFAEVEGDHLFVPEHGVHGFRNDSDAPAAMLMMSPVPRARTTSPSWWRSSPPAAS